ncbi:hypothetical protein I5J36_gp58 [Mycobacterium phage Mendokysei]|uniref:Uncharacterized protein n=1 Tax=Mycobacterium phage Mendokysei TaxID=2099637 RepID=A0A2P1CGG4_9CAUD|nr:hypothetical protein I5J36_gp58 [Mycobacterium phage Mendokysei]AVJ50274.1 hypothetical protein SEA_MENDOKYSEI_58 [Mycobacterium phage Mendokysei]
MSARIVHQRTGKTIGVFADYVEAFNYRRDVLRPTLDPNAPCPFAIRSGGVKDGHLFTADFVSTRPCVHCSKPAVEIDRATTHFIVGDNGSKTGGDECMTTVRGRTKRAGTFAELSAVDAAPVDLDVAEPVDLDGLMVEDDGQIHLFAAEPIQLSF